MAEELDQDWIFRVMEIRKDPSVATVADIEKLASDFIYSLYCNIPRHPIAELAQILTAQKHTYLDDQP